ncbi:unnamed protein product [Diabrotica balteata]|uniref:Dynein regulatory complex subunit 7 n=1 Tax=Diabrotica balteata TaxID=107213 RepID=A0A9N9T2M9_DIABA|nr:unnamed protein product [Diabrotica balteata]
MTDYTIEPEKTVFDYLSVNAEDGEEVEEEEEFSYIRQLDKVRILPEPVDLTHEHLKEIGYELGLIKLCWPEILEPYFEDRTNFPVRYIKNNEKEKLILLYAENFRKQFSFKYPERKPLLLAVENECGILKMVCTTLRPTMLPHPELETWEGCASFIADHIRFEPNEDMPTFLPRRLYSPHTTLLRQSGQSFEIATLLCSALIGVGYNAFVASGYAIKDVTLRIMVRVDCPFPPFKEEEEKPEVKFVEEKYKLKPPRDLRSKFLMMMEKRETDKLLAQQAKIIEEEQAQRLEEEARPPDDLEGQRTHAWVIVLPPNKQIQEPFFIEPSTGFSHPLTTDIYLGIESIWNHQNYYVNLQDCCEGLSNINFDLQNNEKWIHFLIAEPLFQRQHRPREIGDDDLDATEMLEEKHLDMPTSWSMKLNVPHEILKKRFPEGCRTTQFKRVFVEEYAPFISCDGLVSRITRFKDFDCKIPEVIEEVYEYRRDKFIRSISKCDTNVITDYFDKGREDAVIKHIYIRNEDDVHAKRTIFFNHEGRYDALHKIEVDQNEITEHYKNRDDKLYYRQVFYETNEESTVKIGGVLRRPIFKIIQKYERDESKPSYEDIATREFAIVAREIKIKFHYGKNNVTASTRIFIKPPISEFGEEMVFDPELTYGYQAEIGLKRPRQLALFLMFEDQLKEEATVINNIRDVEAQISEFLLTRAREMAFSKLDVPLFNKEQNAEYRQAMLDKEKLARVYKEKEVEEEIDYFAPYLARFGTLLRLTPKQAKESRDACLEEFKDLLVNRANNIQKTFEKMNERLQAKKLYYTTNHDILSEQEEACYFEEVNNIMLIMKTLQIRLNRHKELAAIRYQLMVDYLDKHPKLITQSQTKSLT